MEIQQLKGFLSVARHKGFSKAAEKTFRTQPAVSLQVKALEDELGVKLFDRLGPRKVELTEDGKALYEIASPLIEGLDAIKTRFEEARGGQRKGPAKIATHTSVMVYLLPGIIKEFKKRYPKCELTILNRGKKDILSLVMNGEVDFGICSLVDVPQVIDYRVIAEYHRLLIAPADHPLSKKSRMTLKDIAQYPLVLPPRESNTRAVIDRVFEENGLRTNIALEVTGREASKLYVGMGMGISIINEFYLTKEDRDKLFYRDCSHFFGKAQRGILTRKNRAQSFVQQEFIKTIVSALKK